MINRRALLKLGGQVVVGLAATRIGLASSAGSSRKHLATVNRMIAESGSMWLQVRDRSNGKNPPVIYFGDNGPAYELRHDSNRWHISYRTLTPSELGQFEEFLSTSRKHGVTTEIGQKIYDASGYRLRAWIKNGRRPVGWDVSVENLDGTSIINRIER